MIRSAHVLCGAAFVIGLLRAVAASADEGVSPTDVRATVERSLSFLTDEGVDWKEGRKCASCHHAPMMIWALNEAQNQGYTIERDVLRDVTTWVFAPDDPAKAFVQKRTEGPDRQVRATILMLALGLQAAGTKDPAIEAGRQRLFPLLLEDQADDGSWTLQPTARPPTSGTRELMTPLALLALTDALPDTGADDPQAVARQKGLKSLAEAPAVENLQVSALRLLLDVRLGRPVEERAPAIAKLIEQQNADGGWSQTKELSSDAYATGQTLYVLVTAGVDRASAAVQRAQAFLAKAQRKDGSWPMIPRPAQPGGKSSENDGPITYVGTAWATMGLARSAPIAERKPD